MLSAPELQLSSSAAALALSFMLVDLSHARMPCYTPCVPLTDTVPHNTCTAHRPAAVPASEGPRASGASSRSSFDEAATRLRREASVAALSLQRSQEFAAAKVKLQAFKACEREVSPAYIQLDAASSLGAG